MQVTNRTDILTLGEDAYGISASSIGGGGIGGSATASAEAEYAIGASIGGFGGGAGNGGQVTVNNLAGGNIETRGARSIGVFAQSVGGGGAGDSTGDGGTVGVALTLGGFGAGGGDGGIVGVDNAASIHTRQDYAHGIMAQSIGGAGNSGGAVIVNNFGRIETRGDLSHGVFAQSIGGGASGAAANASEAETSIGIQSGLGAGSGADGGNVTVNNDGIIETFGDGALGIFAQSVGGGGVVSDDSSSDNAFTVNVGGIDASGGNGGDVLVTVSGAIITHGERAHGVVAQSVGGSGGYGGDAKGTQLAIGGTGGSGGDVTVIRTGQIITTGVDSVAIIAQSVAGGGGAGFGRFTTSDDGSGPNSIGFQTPGAAMGKGGVVTIIQTGEIDTFGDRGQGIVAQAVAGGGGLGGTSSLAGGSPVPARPAASAMRKRQSPRRTARSTSVARKAMPSSGRARPARAIRPPSRRRRSRTCSPKATIP